MSHDGPYADYAGVHRDRRYREPIVIDARLRWDGTPVHVFLSLEDAAALAAALQRFVLEALPPHGTQPS
jgi:hypothetical protein